MEKIPTMIGGVPCLLCLSPRRRTVGLKLNEEGAVVVYAPQGISPGTLNRVLEKHKGWIERKQAAWHQARKALEPDKVYFRGQALSLERKDGGKEEVVLKDGRLCLSGLPPQADPWPLLCRWYQQQAAAGIAPRLACFASRMKLPEPRFEIRSWRRRWGDCPEPGRVRFHWRLILLPPEILDYVVVHELAHLKEPGHSRRFWKLVARHLPDYAARRRWLKTWGEPFLHWRWAPPGAIQGKLEDPREGRGNLHLPVE